MTRRTDRDHRKTTEDDRMVRGGGKPDRHEPPYGGMDHPASDRTTQSPTEGLPPPDNAEYPPAPGKPNRHPRMDSYCEAGGALRVSLRRNGRSLAPRFRGIAATILRALGWRLIDLSERLLTPRRVPTPALRPDDNSPEYIGEETFFSSLSAGLKTSSRRTEAEAPSPAAASRYRFRTQPGGGRKP